MEIKFKRLVIHNFMSFGDEEFNFEDFEGMTRIKGQNFDLNQKNGCGKSSLLNALTYGIYGQPPFKIKNENIYNRYIEDHNVRVSVYFESDKKDYRVDSGIRKKQSYCELHEITDGKEKDLTKSSIAETRLFIEKELLHSDINLFMRTIVLNSDPNYNFYNLKSADKKEFIDKLFDIYIFGTMYNEIHREKLDSDKEILALQNQLIVLNKSSEEYKVMIDSFEKSHIEKIETLKGRIKKGEVEYAKKKSSMVKKNVDAISVCEEKIKKTSDEINRINETIQNNDLSINKFKMENKQIDSAVNDRRKIIDKHSTLRSKLCDDCKDVFSDYYNLKKYENDIVKYENRKSSNLKEIEKLNGIQANLNSSKKENMKIQDGYAKELRGLNEEYENAQNELRKYENALNSLKYQLETEMSNENPYIKMMESNNVKVKDINNRLTTIMERYKYIQFGEGILDQDNLKRFIIKDLIGLLNNRIRYYLHKLGAQYDIVFNEDMEYDFVTDVKDGIEFNNFSKGEQARISVATCFAFRDFLSSRSNISSNIFILDEFFDSNVDPMAIEATVEILKEFVDMHKQRTFVISHRSEISDDMFDNIISVEKRNNVSKIRVIM